MRMPNSTIQAIAAFFIGCGAIAVSAHGFEYGIYPVSDGFIANNAKQGYVTSFDTDGVATRLPGVTAEWRWTTTHWGRTGGLVDWNLTEPQLNDDRVVYEQGTAEEWYVNRPSGVEQGWTLNERPGGLGQIVIRATMGGLTPQLSGDSIALLDEDGETVLNYGGLYAYDADKRPLATAMRVSGSDVFILVDDAAAQYPITIDPILTTPTWVAESGQVGAQFGVSSDFAGDVNGDGYDDVIIGANFYTNEQDREGRVYVYFGSPTGLSLNPDWTAEIDQARSEFGISVAGAGDVNNDGYDDVIVGASFYDNGQSNEGGAFMYFGSPSGPSTTADWVAESNQVFAFFGVSVGTAGDVNGDGFDDVIVGAHLYDKGEVDEGAAFLYLGSASGPSLTHDWVGESNQVEAEYGIHVGPAGDVNSDGYDDVIVGAYLEDGLLLDAGRVYVYHGSATGLETTAAWTASSNQGDGRMGYSAAPAGDVNGDGYGDVIVGSYRFDSGNTNEGRAYAYHGSATGLLTTPTWVVESNQDWAYFGYRVDGAGDVNDDGFDDVVVSSVWFDNDFEDEGAVFLYPGTEDGLAAVPIFSLFGSQANSDLGSGLAGGGDVHGDGYDDILVGASGFDNGELNEGRAFLFPGSAAGIIKGPESPEITTDGGNGPGADFTSEDPQVSLEGTNGEDAFEILVDGSAAGVTRPTNTTWAYTGSLGQGDNVIVVTAVDSLGNPSIPDIITVFHDSLAPPPPVITTDGGNGPGQDYFTDQTDVTLAGTTDPQTTTIKVNGSVTGVTYTAGQSTWSYVGTLSEGANDFDVTATDSGGNESAPARIRVTLDTEAPAPPIITTNGGAGPGQDFLTNLESLLLEGTTTADTKFIRVNGSAGGVTYVAGSTDWIYQDLLVEGENVLSIVAIDAAGNISDPTNITITLDLNLLDPPVITTDGGLGGGVSFTTGEANWFIWGTTSSETVSIEVNGGSISPNYTQSSTIWNFFVTLEEGPNAFAVRAVNAQGTSSYPGTITITLDTTSPPVPTITTDGGNGPGVSFATNDAQLILEGLTTIDTAVLMVDGSVVGVTHTPGEVNWQFETALSEGTKVFSVTAADALGNVSAARTISVTLDTIAPAPPVITTDGGNGHGQDFETTNPSVNIAGTVGSGVAGVRVNGSSEGVAYSPSVGVWTYTPSLNQGANALEFTAYDAAGNVSEIAPLTVTLDATPPPAPVITTDGGNGAGNDFATAAASVLLEGTTSGGATGVFVNGSQSGVQFDEATGAWSFNASLVVGSNAFDVRARDAAGNVSNPANIVITRTSDEEPNGASLTLNADRIEVALGEVVNITGNLSINPPPEAGLTGLHISIRYRLEGVVEVKRDAIADANGDFQDTYAPSRSGVWTVQARFTDGEDLPVTDWTAPITITVTGSGDTTDLNGDGVTNAVDIQLMINAILNGGSIAGGDVNGDGRVNSADLQFIINVVLFGR